MGCRSSENGLISSGTSHWSRLPPMLLAWQIEVGEHWSFNPDLIAELEVHFISDGVDRTRVELEHRDLDRLGEQAAMVREVFDSPAGFGCGQPRNTGG